MEAAPDDPEHVPLQVCAHAAGVVQIGELLGDLAAQTGLAVRRDAKRRELVRRGGDDPCQTVDDGQSIGPGSRGHRLGDAVGSDQEDAPGGIVRDCELAGPEGDHVTGVSKGVALDCGGLCAVGLDAQHGFGCPVHDEDAAVGIDVDSARLLDLSERGRLLERSVFLELIDQQLVAVGVGDDDLLDGPGNGDGALKISLEDEVDATASGVELAKALFLRVDGEDVAGPDHRLDRDELGGKVGGGVLLVAVHGEEEDPAIGGHGDVVCVSQGPPGDVTGAARAGDANGSGEPGVGMEDHVGIEAGKRTVDSGGGQDPEASGHVGLHVHDALAAELSLERAEDVGLDDDPEGVVRQDGHQDGRQGRAPIVEGEVDPDVHDRADRLVDDRAERGGAGAAGKAPVVLVDGPRFQQVLMGVVEERCGAIRLDTKQPAVLVGHEAGSVGAGGNPRDVRIADEHVLDGRIDKRGSGGSVDGVCGGTGRRGVVVAQDVSVLVELLVGLAGPLGQHLGGVVPVGPAGHGAAPRLVAPYREEEAAVRFRHDVPVEGAGKRVPEPGSPESCGHAPAVGEGREDAVVGRVERVGVVEHLGSIHEAPAVGIGLDGVCSPDPLFLPEQEVPIEVEAKGVEGHAVEDPFHRAVDPDPLGTDEAQAVAGGRGAGLVIDIVRPDELVHEALDGKRLEHEVCLARLVGGEEPHAVADAHHEVEHGIIDEPFPGALAGVVGDVEVIAGKGGDLPLP